MGVGRMRCGSCNTKIRRYRAKAAAVKYLGGKCVTCGWAEIKLLSSFTILTRLKKILLLAMLRIKVGIPLKKKLENVFFCAQIAIQLSTARMMVRCS